MNVWIKTKRDFVRQVFQVIKKKTRQFWILSLNENRLSETYDYQKHITAP